MPRKKGGMLFELHPTPAKGKDGRTMYYARPAGGNKLTMEQIDHQCALHYGLRPNELTRAMHAFLEACGEWIAKGYRIETLIGSFAPRLALGREITDPDSVKPADVSFAGVEYTPGKHWDEPVKRWLDGFRQAEKANASEILADEEALVKTLDSCLRRFRGYVTVRIFSYATGLTYYSAQKQLDRWTRGQNPRLLKTRQGQQYIYTPI